MKLLTLAPYHASAFNFSFADRNGATIAENEFLQAALTTNSVQELCVLNANDRRHTDDCLSLYPEIGKNGVPGRPITNLTFGLLKAKVEAGENIVGLVSIRDFPFAAHTRRSFNIPFPLFTIIHAIPFADMLTTYISAILFAEPCDAVVVSSTAGEAAVRSLITQCQEILNAYEESSLRESTMHASIHKIPLAVREEMLVPIPKDLARTTLGLSSSEQSKILLYVGRLTSNYKADLEPLILAFAEVSRTDQDTILLIAGKDIEEGYAAKLQSLSCGYGIGDRVSFATNFAPQLKRFFYAAADVFVSPVDNVQETFGLAILEAMAAGLPVVASNWSGYRDLVVHGETGYLVDTWLDVNDLQDPFDIAHRQLNLETELAARTIVDVSQMTKFITQLLASPVLRRDMGGAGRERVKKSFTWPVVMKSYQALWNDQLTRATMSMPPAKRIMLDRSAIFKGYPRARAPVEQLHASCSKAVAGAMASRAPRAPHGGGEELNSGLSEFMTPQSVGDLLNQGPEERAVVRRLLKKGVLQLK
jgi:glycosyltransferase involved in cell wall biosynthesis